MSEHAYIYGHSAQLRFLANAFKDGRISHCYLFAGTDGIGKGLVARYLCAMLHCSAKGVKPCLKCQDCLRSFSPVSQPQYLTYIRDINNPVIIHREPVLERLFREQRHENELELYLKALAELKDMGYIEICQLSKKEYDLKIDMIRYEPSLYVGKGGAAEGGKAMEDIMESMHKKDPLARRLAELIIMNQPYLFYQGAIKIDLVRNQVRRQLQFEAGDQGYRFIILDEAHKMTTEAQNSLLKILEEPPPKTVFILLTAKPHALLPTIRSRSQIIYFQCLSLEQVVEGLKDLTSLDDDTIAHLARLSGGSIGQALYWDYDAYMKKRDELFEVFASHSSLGMKNIFTLSHKLKGTGIDKIPGAPASDTVRNLVVLAYLIADILHARYLDNRKLLANYDLLGKIKNLDMTISDLIIAGWIENIHKGIKDLSSYANPQLTVDIISIDILRDILLSRRHET